MSCGVGHRHGLDPVLLCLWGRPAAVALICLTPSLGTSMCCGCGPKNEQTKSKKKMKWNNRGSPAPTASAHSGNVSRCSQAVGQSDEDMPSEISLTRKGVIPASLVFIIKVFGGRAPLIHLNCQCTAEQSHLRRAGQVWRCPPYEDRASMGSRK